MTAKPIDLQAAEWLVVGYVKSWTWTMFDLTMGTATGKHCSEFQFLPHSNEWSGNVLVRAYIAQNWPKLNEFLSTATPEKALATAKEIVKLKWNGERPLGSITRSERNELEKSKQELRRATTAYNYSRKMFTKGGAKYRGVAK